MGSVRLGHDTLDYLLDHGNNLDYEDLQGRRGDSSMGHQEPFEHDPGMVSISEDSVRSDTLTMMY